MPGTLHWQIAMAGEVVEEKEYTTVDLLNQNNF